MQTQINTSTLDKQRNLWLPLSIISSIIWGITIIGLINVYLALVVSAVASAKGRSASKWYFYGVWIWPIALIHIAFLSVQSVVDDVGPDGIQINTSTLKTQRKRWLPLSCVAVIAMPLAFLPLRELIQRWPFRSSELEEFFWEHSLEQPFQTAEWQELFWVFPWQELSILFGVSSVIFSILMALAVSYVAFVKGYSASKWFFYGVWVWFIALLHIIFMPKRNVVEDTEPALRAQKPSDNK